MTRRLCDRDSGLWQRVGVNRSLDNSTIEQQLDYSVHLGGIHVMIGGWRRRGTDPRDGRPMGSTQATYMIEGDPIEGDPIFARFILVLQSHEIWVRGVGGSNLR